MSTRLFLLDMSRDDRMKTCKADRQRSLLLVIGVYYFQFVYRVNSAAPSEPGCSFPDLPLFFLILIFQ